LFIGFEIGEFFELGNGSTSVGVELEGGMLEAGKGDFLVMDPGKAGKTVEVVIGNFVGERAVREPISRMTGNTEGSGMSEGDEEIMWSGCI
jgi:hypothetical protein